MYRSRIPPLPASLRWLSVGLIISAIGYSSLLAPAPGPTEPIPLWDKALHVLVYLVLGLSVAYATAETGLHPARRVVVVLAVALTVGLAVEVLQGPLPDRQFEVADLAADVIGAGLATGSIALEPRVRYVSVFRLRG